MLSSRALRPEVAVFDRGGRHVAWLALLALVVVCPAGRAEDAASRLLAAARARDAATVASLLRGGASPDASDRSGWTALHEAAAAGDLATAQVLLEAGASPDLRSRARGTPLDVAERSGQPAMARLLRQHGARGSGKSIGDTVCVRPWKGEGYCGRVEAVDTTRFRLRVTQVVGCGGGCAADAACSDGRPVGPGGVGPGEVLTVPASCLTHTGLR